MRWLKIFALAGGLIACGPAIAANGHCYTMGAAQLIVPDLFNKNPGWVAMACRSVDAHTGCRLRLL